MAGFGAARSRATDGPALFDSNGEVDAKIKIWTGLVTTDSTGRLTVDYSSAGFTSPPKVSVSAHSDSTNTLQNREWATLRGSPSTNSARIYTIRGNVIISLLLGGGVTIRTAPNVKVDVIAIGT